MTRFLKSYQAGYIFSKSKFYRNFRKIINMKLDAILPQILCDFNFNKYKTNIDSVNL